MGLIRLILAISVITAHFGAIGGSHLIGGPMAVEIFFMISGFYMLMVWEEKYKKRGAISFWKKRWLKIYPFYWLVLIFSLISALSLGWWPKFKINGLTKAWTGWTNVAILGQDVSMFMAVDKGGGLYWTKYFLGEERPFYKLLLAPQAWTLALEMMFYLMVPWLAKLKNKWLIMMAAIGLMGRFWLYKQGLNHDPWNARIFLLEIQFFLAGMIAYRIYKRRENRGKIIGIVGEMGWIIIALVFQFLPSSGKKQWLFYGITWLVIPWIFGLNKDNKWDRYLGEISYGIYIGHFLVGNTLEGLGVRQPNLAVLTAIISVLVGTMSNKFNGLIQVIAERNKREIK